MVVPNRFCTVQAIVELDRLIVTGIESQGVSNPGENKVDIVEIVGVVGIIGGAASKKACIVENLQKNKISREEGYLAGGTPYTTLNSMTTTRKTETTPSSNPTTASATPTLPWTVPGATRLN